MGAAESMEDLSVIHTRELEEIKKSEGDEGSRNFQDMTYPWFHIIQWSCESIPSDVVFKWNYTYIKQDVFMLTSRLHNINTLKRDEGSGQDIEEGGYSSGSIDMKLIEHEANDVSVREFLKFCPTVHIQNFTMDDETNFLHWAGVLLVQIPSLSRLRYKVVPSRLSEDNFWMRYFAAIKNIVISQVINSAGAAPASQPSTPQPSVSFTSAENGIYHAPVSTDREGYLVQTSVHESFSESDSSSTTFSNIYADYERREYDDCIRCSCGSGSSSMYSPNTDICGIGSSSSSDKYDIASTLGRYVNDNRLVSSYVCS